MLSETLDFIGKKSVSSIVKLFIEKSLTARKIYKNVWRNLIGQFYSFKKLKSTKLFLKQPAKNLRVKISVIKWKKVQRLISCNEVI